MSDFELTKQQIKLINEYRTSHSGGMVYSDDAIISILKTDGTWFCKDAVNGSMFKNSFSKGEKTFGLEVEKQIPPEPAKHTPVNKKDLAKFIKDFEVSDYLHSSLKENIKYKEQLDILKETAGLKDRKGDSVYPSDYVVRFFSDDEAKQKLDYSKQLVNENPTFVEKNSIVNLVRFLTKEKYSQEESAVIIKNADFWSGMADENWVPIKKKRVLQIINAQKDSPYKFKAENFYNLQMHNEVELKEYLKYCAKGGEASAELFLLDKNRNLNLPLIAMVNDKDVQESLFKMNTKLNDLFLNKELRNLAIGVNRIEDPVVMARIKESLKNPDDEKSLHLISINNLVKAVNYQKHADKPFAGFYDEDMKNLVKVLNDNKDIYGDFVDEINGLQKETSLFEDILVKIGLKKDYMSPDMEDLIKQIKNAPMIKFMNANPDDKITNYLYEKFYLEGNESAWSLNIINQKFGCKVLTSPAESYNDPETLEFINKELNSWKNVSGGKANLPKILNLNTMKERFHRLDDRGGVAGYAEKSNKNIHIGGNYRVEDALRHEIMHLNDNRLNDCVDVKAEAKNWRSEFANAGISGGHIDYAYTNKNEFVAVASEGNYSKYSPEFKKYLISLGMPEWVFKLPKNKVKTEDDSTI